LAAASKLAGFLCLNLCLLTDGFILLGPFKGFPKGRCGLGRRRRKIVRKTARPPPSIFVCPVCSAQAVTVTHGKNSERATVMCGACKTTADVDWFPSYTAVDAYSAWYDIVTQQKASQ